MATLPRKTLTDYLVIAISPALIMTLIGSLAFFLLEVFYQGQYQGRLQYIFALFIIGATLIGRISIEEGRERAVLFAIPLGVVTLLAVYRFVEFKDPELAAWSFLINLGIVMLIGWSADKLVWDCTLIDETEEDSGAGLLETVGLDHADTGSLQADTTTQAMESEPASSLLPDRRGSGWWDRFVERRRRPHAPGVWVVYFSLAAVALFGVGQLFIPIDDLPLRRYAFQLLCVDTASSLGLLLTTSFLGLRRYLRQRRQAMPGAMTRHWLTLGAVLLVSVMAVAMVVPRPDPEYAVSEWPQYIRSPKQKSSRHGMGREPARDHNPQARRTPSPETSESKERPTSTGESSDKGKQETSSQSESPSQKAQTKDARSSGNEEQKTSEKKDAESHNARTHATRSADKKELETSEQKGSASQNARTEDHSSANDRGRLKNPFPSGHVPSWIPSLGRLVSATVIKWIVYGALVLAALWALWTNRHGLAAALRQFWQDVLDFWGRLFGGWRKPPDDSEQEVAAVRRSFADFADPFAAGLADRWPPAELVRYSFEALEAWAADRGCPREPDQTPNEFARRLAARVPETLAEDAYRLADLYCQAAYAQRALSQSQTAWLTRLWQQLSVLR